MSGGVRAFPQQQLLRATFVLLLTLLLGACATQSSSLMQSAAPGLPRQAELASVPFFPQERYQCGPAALAMSLNAAGIRITPEELVPQVYVPAREGSLQPEMLASGRRNGAVSIAIPPKLEALMAEIAAGNPVVVLQNLSLPWFPLWHYAVAVGYDLDRGEIILRSGVTEREVMPLSTFERTWSRGGYWGMVTVPPDRLPRTVDQGTATSALVAYEKSAPADRARVAYGTALQRWPTDLTLQLGYGNAAYASGDLVAAAAAFRRAAEAHPENVPVLNNLATVLAETGQLEEAGRVAEHAVALGGRFHEQAKNTLESIRKKKNDPPSRSR